MCFSSEQPIFLNILPGICDIWFPARIIVQSFKHGDHHQPEGIHRVHSGEQGIIFRFAVPITADQDDREDLPRKLCV